MRIRIGAGALCILLSASASAQAQQASSFFTNVPPGSIVNKPIDTSGAIRPNVAQQSFTSRFNFAALFNRNSTPTGKAQRGVSNLPAPSSFPSTQYKNYQMVGRPPYLLHWPWSNGASPLTPPLPTIPNPSSTVVGPGS